MNTEHIKSHLQKYRNNANKSIENFSAYYESELKAKFMEFSKNDSWKKDPELDLEKVSAAALHVNEANSGRVVETSGPGIHRELRSSTNGGSSHNSGSGEVDAILNKHALLFTDFVEITDELVELGNELKRSLNQLGLSRGTSTKRRY